MLRNEHTPAFPATISDNTRSFVGLTKFEYFVAEAMKGLLANPHWRPDHHTGDFVNFQRKLIATAAEYAQLAIEKCNDTGPQD